MYASVVSCVDGTTMTLPVGRAGGSQECSQGRVCENRHSPSKGMLGNSVPINNEWEVRDVLTARMTSMM